MAFVVKYAGMHSPEGLPKANSLRRARVDVVCSLRDPLRMRHILFSALVIVAFMTGCVDSKEARSGAQSAMSQAEPDRLDALFSHPSPDSIPGGQRGEPAPLLLLGAEGVIWTQGSIPIRPLMSGSRGPIRNIAREPGVS